MYRTNLHALLTLLFLLLWQPYTVAQEVVNDVSQINPIFVNRVLAPHSVEEIIAAVTQTKGAVSIGGGRFSMGGQIASEDTLHLDMREFNQILTFSAEAKEITVQSGATWRQIQQYIDPYNLSVKIMQSYADFTVGGSLSVNVHGRYVGYGPLVLSVKQIGLVLADGRYLHASPTENAELFYAAIGGYGGIGVIIDATLELADNIKLLRTSKVMPVKEYRDFFISQIRDNPKAIMHNAHLYPNAYDTVRAVTFEATDLPVTRNERLVAADANYWFERLLMSIVSEAPGGKILRQYLLDPLHFMGERVVWRNYEASYTAAELEPTSRQDKSYVLQEYFVPVANINAFVPQMAQILQQHQVNVINISIRHAKPDTGTLLAWAPQEVFALVLYYKQGTDAEAKSQVKTWTQKLIDAALENGGRYYLPYQIHASEAQFKQAYPKFDQFFAIKQQVDPENKFRNKLWDKYYLPTETRRQQALNNNH